MHSLIITAHPSSKGFTQAICETYCNASLAKRNTCEVLDLYKTELKCEFLHFESTDDMKKPDPVRDSLQAKISKADELVFIFPIWWVNVPAILKNFFDVVLTPGFAYKYTKKTIIFPDKLLKGKTAKIFCTCDQIGWLYWLIGNPVRVTTQIAVLGWCWIKTKKFVVFDQMRKSTEEGRIKMLERVRNSV